MHMDAVVQPRGERPKLVWAVFLFYILSAGFNLLLFALVYSGLLPVTPDPAAYYRNLSIFDWVVTVLSGLLHVGGAIAIFLLRKIAFYLFSAAFVLVILEILVHTYTSNFIDALGGPGAVGTLLVYGILLAVCIYAWRLSSRGVLK